MDIIFNILDTFIRYIPNILTEGLIFSIMVLGVFITFRILDFPDLSVDGSFPLGSAILAILVVNNVPVIIALVIAFTGGLLAGFFTAFIHNKLKVPNLLSGILTMIILYSINLRVMGNSPNLNISRSYNTTFSVIADIFSFIPEKYAVLIFLILLTLVLKVLMDIFFHTDLGLVLRAMGNNHQMVINQGVNPEYIKIIGVGLSNGLVALSGAFFAQYQRYSDVSLGQGIIIMGLASVMIGEVVWPSRNIYIVTARAIIGSIIYNAIMVYGRELAYWIKIDFVLFEFQMTPNDLKLLTGFLIIGCLWIIKMRDEKPVSLKMSKQKN